MALYSSVLQQCSILALCGPIFLAEQCTAMYGCILHWSLAGLEVALYSSGLAAMQCVGPVCVDGSYQCTAYVWLFIS